MTVIVRVLLKLFYSILYRITLTRSLHAMILRKLLQPHSHSPIALLMSMSHTYRSVFLNRMDLLEGSLNWLRKMVKLGCLANVLNEINRFNKMIHGANINCSQHKRVEGFDKCSNRGNHSFKKTNLILMSPNSR